MNLEGIVAMPGAPGYNPALVDAKIEELKQIQARNGSLSVPNARMMLYWTYQQQFRGLEQYIAIIPNGAIPIPGAPNRGAIHCLPAEAAANQLAFAEASGHKIRLAKPNEVEAKRAYESALTNAAKQRIALDAAENATRQMAALLSMSAAPPMAARTEVPPAPIAEPFETVGAPNMDFQVDLPGVTAVQSAVVQATSQEDPRLAELVTAKQLEGLRAIAIHTVEQLASADAKELAKHPRIGGAASKLIVAAVEVVQGSAKPTAA